jgi:hypothetical protein
VIQNIPSVINSVAWSTTFDANFLVTGSGDGSILKWKVVHEGASCSVYFDWSVTNGTLAVTGASIEGVRGLTGVNKKLLRQRGAIGEPENLLHESSKNVMTMCSVVNELQRHSGETNATSAIDS